jgi:hypothetical protein
MVDQLVQIYEGQPDTVDCQFVVKLIENRSGREPLFDYTIDGLQPKAIGKEINERHYNLISGTKLLRDTITHYYQTIEKHENCKMESCICNSLDHSYSILKNKEFDKIQLIVLSDMLEDCSKNKSIQNLAVNLCDVRNYERDLADILVDIEAFYLPEHLLHDYIKPENLYFIHGGIGYANKNDCLEEDDVEKVWQAYLKKMGYSDQDFDPKTGISYTSDVPNRLINK